MIEDVAQGSRLGIELGPAHRQGRSRGCSSSSGCLLANSTHVSLTSCLVILASGVHLKPAKPISCPHFRVYGVGKIGFWSVVNGLTGMDLGSRCNEEWQ